MVLLHFIAVANFNTYDRGRGRGRVCLDHSWIHPWLLYFRKYNLIAKLLYVNILPTQLDNYRDYNIGHWLTDNINYFFHLIDIILQQARTMKYCILIDSTQIKLSPSREPIIFYKYILVYQAVQIGGDLLVLLLK